jgi:hypothetical protein
MSEYVVHFTKEVLGRTAYDSQISILYHRTVRALSAFGAARRFDALGDTQRCACFSEIPLDRLNRLVERRSRYGVGFSQDALVRAGGGRVWYIDNESALASSFRQLMNANTQSPLDASSPLWKLTPFIDFPGSYGETEYRFEWEREWRVPGGLTFSPPDVAFLFVPEELHSQARVFFDQAELQNIGPSYRCPLLDPLWADDRIQQALALI